ncbi:MAG TPA: Amuc_1099 family pilus-like system protein [Verrucomicrobiae bacterium]|nr:Amuc_1099 family pilus-like system protein [Verrucomicrobiae bacterium]
MKRVCLILGFVAGVVLCSRPSAAQYTTDFQTNIISGVASNWMGDYLVASNTYADALVIQGGAALSNGFGYVGYEAGSSNNSVLVTDLGSAWSNRYDLTIGNSGPGNSLVISNGGLVRNLYSCVGSNVSSSGNRVIVSGAGSSWRNIFDLSVGYSGSGNSLVVSNGALVRNDNGAVGYNDGSSNNAVLVTGSGSVWSNYLNLDVGNSGMGNSLVIADGGKVYANYGFIGNNTTAAGNAVVITGSGSIWSNAADVLVGFSGSGNTLVISNGGQAVNGALNTAGTAYVAYGSGSSNNSVVVTGTGSVWRITDSLSSHTSLFLGYSGASNSLAIADGGGAYDHDGYIGRNTNSVGNSVVVSDGGSVWSNGYDVYMGYYGAGNNLTIGNGGQVLNRFGYVGYDTNSRSNSVLVTGPGSLWNNATNLYIGYSSASNSLVISGGASVSNAFGYIGSATAAANNRVLVTDSGSVWSNGGSLFVGGSGPGNSLAISNSGYVFSSLGYIGSNTTALGNSVVVDGSDSIWMHDSSLYVGYSGASNKLVIANGGSVRAFTPNLGVGLAPSYLGYNASSSNNSVLVSGQDAVWYTGDLYPGFSGRANSLAIRNGGQVICRGDPHISLNSSSVSNVIVVSDSGSVWSNTSGIYLGYAGGGNTLVISNGGFLVSGGSLGSDNYVGYNSSSLANSVLITGTGSTWRVDGGLYVGYFGAGNNLVVDNGGCVSNDNSLYVGYTSPGNGLVVSNGGQVINADAYLGSSSTSNTNTARVLDGGVWQNNTLQIGYQGSSNSLVVVGGSVSATNLIIGAASATCDNWVELDSGSIVVTNATGDAVFEVRNGKLILNGGTLQVDQFVMTNACAQFVRTGGILNYGTAVLDPNASAVGDGIPNWWKQQYGLDPLDPSVANADPDGDGMSNLEEYQAGTDPTNNASAFRIIELWPDDDDMFLTWTAVGGKRYALQTTAGDSGGFTNDFIDLNPAIVATGTGETEISVLHLGGATNAPARFYRVRLVP